jgi:uncharacterized membrane protein
MRLDKKREEELAQRQGMTGRTIVGFIWLLISMVAAYFLVDYLIAEKYLNLNMFYDMGIPRSVPEIVFQIVIILLIVAIMQFVLIFGYVVASPDGRRRTGDPSLYSRSKDPFDNGGRG